MAPMACNFCPWCGEPGPEPDHCASCGNTFDDVPGKTGWPAAVLAVALLAAGTVYGLRSVTPYHAPTPRATSTFVESPVGATAPPPAWPGATAYPTARPASLKPGLEVTPSPRAAEKRATPTPARTVVVVPPVPRAPESPARTPTRVYPQPSRVPLVVAPENIPPVGPTAYNERPDEAYFAAIDAHAMAAPASAKIDVASLAAWLDKGAPSDLLRARAIFRWITAHVRYDEDFLRTGRRPSGEPEEVLKSGVAICEGYARLFDALAQEMGLQSTLVEGYSRGNGYAPGQPYPAQPDHGWNAVSINGKWGLIDATWGAGCVNEDRQYQARFSPLFFLGSPREMIYTHLPADPRWQLLAREVSGADQQKLPYVTPVGLEMNVRPLTHRSAVVETGGEARMAFEAPAGVVLHARVVRQDSEVPGSAFVQQEDGRWTVLAKFPQAGAYDVQLFAGGSEGGRQAISYRVVASAASTAGFPKMYRSFAEHGAQLQFPLDGRLSARRPQDFAIKVPGAEAVMLVNNGEWVPLAAEGGGRFTGTVEVAAGKVVLAARFPNGQKDHYDYLVEYRGE
ncbi:MAG: hypothetical protein FJX76_25520 [Armatimonadetes bacterium]|nr:hypothetical protein [Armatimonadota bacterium]